LQKKLIAILRKDNADDASQQTAPSPLTSFSSLTPTQAAFLNLINEINPQRTIDTEKINPAFISAGLFSQQRIHTKQKIDPHTFDPAIHHPAALRIKYFL
jgi:hypothetical protein